MKGSLVPVANSADLFLSSFNRNCDREIVWHSNLKTDLNNFWCTPTGGGGAAFLGGNIGQG